MVGIDFIQIKKQNWLWKALEDQTLARNKVKHCKNRDSQTEKSENERKLRNRHNIGESDNRTVRNNPHQDDSINKYCRKRL